MFGKITIVLFETHSSKSIQFQKKLKIMVDKPKAFCYSSCCVSDDTVRTGCGSAWLERLIWDQEVAGSNPVTPTFSTNLYAGVVQW